MEIQKDVLVKELNAVDKAIQQVIITDFEAITAYKPVVMHPVETEKELLHRGTINSITGTAGSRKTTFITGLVAETSHKRKILWIDTEQTDQDIKYTHGKLERLKADMKNITFAAFMRNESEIKPLELLDILIKKYSPGLIIMDNVTDFDDNSVLGIENAVTLTRKLSKLAKTNDNCILGVIHANETKTSDTAKGRGHIGSEFLRKSHVIMNVYIDAEINNVSYVEFKKNRTAFMKPFAFNVDEKNTPDFAEAQYTKNYEEKKKKGNDIELKKATQEKKNKQVKTNKQGQITLM